MSAPGSLSSVPAEGSRDRPTNRPETETRAPRRGRRGREKRFEIGFFLRKVVNGWLEYYKLFPPNASRETEAQPSSRSMRAAAASTASGETDTAEASSPLVLRSTSHPITNDDPGPGTETRIEAGIVFRVVTEPAPSEDDDEEG